MDNETNSFLSLNYYQVFGCNYCWYKVIQHISSHDIPGCFNSLAVRFHWYRVQNVVILSIQSSFALFCLFSCSSGFVPWEIH